MVSASCGIFSTLARALAMPFGFWVGAQTSHLPSRTEAVQFIGSMAMWARNGVSYVASIFLAADANHESGAPIFLSSLPGVLSSSASFALWVSDDSCAPGPLSHSMVKALRPAIACQVESATTATPPHK